MTEQPTKPTLDVLVTQYRDALDAGDGAATGRAENALHEHYPDYAARAVRDALAEHDQYIAIDSARDQLFAALAALNTGVRDARTALRDAEAAYDVELHPQEGGRLIPGVLDQIEVQLAALHHITRNAQRSRT